MSVSPKVQTINSDFYDVIVSDDCPDHSARQAVEECGFARWVKGPNKGIAANRNNAVSKSSGPWILFIDDDVISDPDLIGKHYLAAFSNKWDSVQGVIEPVDYPDNILWYAPCVLAQGPTVTANLAIRRSSFQRIGGFNEHLTISHEDVDLGRRMIAAGLRLHFASDAIVKHPARYRSLSQVWFSMLQQSCQSYFLNYSNSSSVVFCPPKVLSLVTWAVIFYVRVLRIEWYLKPTCHRFRPVQAAFIRLFVLPFACIRIHQSYH